MVSGSSRRERSPRPPAEPPPSPAVEHLRALLDAPLPEDALGDVRDAHLAAVVAAATALPPDDLVAAGLLGRSGTRYEWAAVPWPRTWTRSVLTTVPGADGQHRAMWWRGRTGGVVRLWVDGRAVVLPPFDGVSPLQESGVWVADRLFAAEVAVAGRDRGAAPSFGLLVCDPATGRDRWELPVDGETWPIPVVRVEDGRVLLLPRPGAEPARTWDLDDTDRPSPLSGPAPTPTAASAPAAAPARAAPPPR